MRLAQQFPAPYIWFNGGLVPAGEARVHAMSTGVRYGANIFEGVRSYWSEGDQEMYLFRVKEHYRRLADSAKVMGFPAPAAVAENIRRLQATIQANNFRQDVHILHVLYAADLFDHITTQVEEAIAVRPVGRPPGYESGLKVQVSHWQRISDNVMPPRVKAGGNYHNSRMGMVQAKADGYDSVIFLNHLGRVAEGPGACVGLVRRGTLVTPPITASLLESVTRATVLQLAGDLGYPVEQREVDKTELYVADEVFFMGTMAEITPVVRVDRFTVGDGTPGSITRHLQRTYMEVTTGRLPQYREWLTPVSAAAVR